jgi:hypothetical protein
MKRTFFVLLALLCAGAPALAQTPMPRPTPNAAMRQQFRQMRTQMREINETERSQMLGALSAAHRQLLASIVGQLATSTQPDYRAAAQRLDVALSSGEKQAILNAAQTARSKRRAAMEAMRSQMPDGGPGPMMRAEREREPMMNGERHTPTAGELLLGLALRGPGMDRDMMMLRPPMLRPR